MKEVHVAVGVVRKGREVLIARRPEHVHQGGLLEFPGGKVEAGETVQQALARELAEEVGIAVPEASLRPVIGIRHDYGDKRVFLDVWETDQFSGTPHGQEGQPIRWLATDALRDVDFPAANRPIIRALTLPSMYPITGGEGLAPEALLEQICVRLDRLRPEWCLFRAPWLETVAYVALASRLLEWCNRRHIRLMLHGAPALLDQVPAAGIHLPWRIARGLEPGGLAIEGLLGVSCHNRSELVHAAQLGADFATLGPVCATRSHPGSRPLGWPAFEGLVAQAVMPVFALGGLAFDARSVAREAGAQGVAGISAWWQC